MVKSVVSQDKWYITFAKEGRHRMGYNIDDYEVVEFRLEKFNVPAYKGSYGEQPCLWVDKAFVIRNAFAKLEKKQINKVKQDGKTRINN